MKKVKNKKQNGENPGMPTDQGFVTLLFWFLTYHTVKAIAIFIVMILTIGFCLFVNIKKTPTADGKEQYRFEKESANVDIKVGKEKK